MAKFHNDFESGVMTFRGVIADDESAISANEFIDAINGYSGDLVIKMNSPGGVVTEGLSMYNAVKARQGKTIVEIDALCASIATVVACAADEVRISPVGKFMIHRSWTVAAGNAIEFRSTAELMEMMDADIASVYADKTGKSIDELMDMMTKETWFNAEQAVSAGFADSIIDSSGGSPSNQLPLSKLGVSSVVRALAESAMRRNARNLE